MAKAQEEKTVTTAAFLASLNKKKASLVKGAKEERQTGYLEDAAILTKLGVEEGDRKTFPASVSKVVFSFAKDDTARPAFRFHYIVDSSDPRAKGTVVQNYYILEEGKKQDGTVWQTEEQAAAKIAGEFQGLGEDTSGWTVEDFVTAAQKHTKDKTPISVTISAYRNKKDEIKMNVTPNPVADSAPADNSDLEEFDGNAWVGVYIEFAHESVDGTVRMLIESYDADTDSFIGVDDNGERWEGDYAISTSHEFVESESQEPAE
jgi:D-alanyl-D-alanine carboxypeptidase